MKYLFLTIKYCRVNMNGTAVSRTFMLCPVSSSLIILDSDYFAGIDFDADEKRVVFEVSAFRQRVVRYESRKTESQAVRFLTRSLEIFPSRIRYEAFDDVARLKQKVRKKKHE